MDKNDSILRFERNLDWNLLKVFLEITRAGGVSRAADRMARQQPAVSSALRRLEDYVGAVLCRRGPKGFELTDEGRAMEEICEQVHKYISRIPSSIGDASAEIFGQLRLIMVQNLVCPVLDATIAEFSRAHPRIELLINLALLPEIEEALVRGEAELGVAPLSRTNEGLRYDLLYREQHRPYCGRGHHLYGRTFDDPDDLREEAFILPAQEEAEAVTLYRERFGWGRNSTAKSPHLDEVRRLVIAGLGIGFLPEEMLVNDVAAGQLWALMPPQPEAQDDVFVISNPAGGRTIAVRRFLDMLDRNVSRAEEDIAAVDAVD